MPVSIRFIARYISTSQTRVISKAERRAANRVQRIISFDNAHRSNSVDYFLHQLISLHHAIANFQYGRSFRHHLGR